MQDGSAVAVAPLRLGEKAPSFAARSTLGAVRLDDFRGHWLLLFSHPADFTPVCTSEFVALARAHERFRAIDCALMGVSIDSLFSHLAWVRSIRDRFDVVIDFPIVEDPTLEIAKAYGMVGPDARDASTVRATYVLDPEGVLRASTWYPASVGRSVEELLRLVQALQRVHTGEVLAPEGWRPGKDVLAVPRPDLKVVLAGAAPADWFYTPMRDKKS